MIMNMRARWLVVRSAAVNYDGLISTTSLMIGVGAIVQEDAKAMILAGIAGLVAGACSTAIREFVSALSESSEQAISNHPVNDQTNASTDNVWLNSLLAAAASAIAFTFGAVVPLLAAASTVNYCHHLRMVVVVAASSLTLLGFGWLGGVLLGIREPQTHECQYLLMVSMKSSFRVLVGGWIAIVISFLSTKYLFMASYTSNQLPN